jgi:hypothetical protein
MQAMENELAWLREIDADEEAERNAYSNKPGRH